MALSGRRAATIGVAAAGVLAVAVLAVALAVLVRDGETSAQSSGLGRAPLLSAEVVQLRRDEVLGRVEIALRNDGGTDVVVEQLALQAPGFAPSAPVPKDSPVPAGQVVNLPIPYGEARCGKPPLAEEPVVRVRVRGAAGWVEVRSPQSRDLLELVRQRDCLAQRLSREVSLAFRPGWRQEGRGPDLRLVGVLEARLRDGARSTGQDITQLAGSVIYDLAPAQPAEPLARLRPGRPVSAVPVVVSVARCDPHARAETKQPYRFLVWLAEPGGEEHALSPRVSPADEEAFQAVCPL